MKISNKQEVQQIEFNHSSDFSFKDFINIDKKRTTKTYSFLVHNTTSKEILPPCLGQVIEQANLTHSHLFPNVFWKQNLTGEDGGKQT